MGWEKIKDGYEFRVYFQHGQHSSRTVETVNCQLDDKQFEKISKILSHLKDGVHKYRNEYTEKVAEYIGQKTGISENDVMQVIGDIVLSDIKWEDPMAQVDYIEVYRFEDGQVQKARI